MLRAHDERSVALETLVVMQPYARLEEHHASNFEAKISISWNPHFRRENDSVI